MCNECLQIECGWPGRYLFAEGQGFDYKLVTSAFLRYFLNASVKGPFFFQDDAVDHVWTGHVMTYITCIPRDLVGVKSCLSCTGPPIHWFTPRRVRTIHWVEP